MNEFLSELPTDLYYELLKIYLIDFHLFGYQVPALDNSRAFQRNQEG